MTTHIQEKTIKITLSGFNSFLGIEDMDSYFFSFPDYISDETVIDPIEDMFMYFFHQAPDYGSHTMLSIFLQPEHIPLYHFTLNCVISIASRNRTEVTLAIYFLCMPWFTIVL
ncbi:hypothetical protein AXF42_Ash020677 [Apostasia shenzhenica]|uniref:Uncharacterized protein n=1 Tax=Apostasia shenzhenica TaxID=1088818 RepID=A0A2H9ZW51_9ASPA|nr:hypothetical protein AXF42_Ash020677 [Apostasia shenzhenica]